MNKNLTFLVILLSFTAITGVNAAQLDVSADTTLTGDQAYDGNTGQGIYTSGTGGTVITNDRITANNNTNAGIASDTGVELNFQGNGSNSLIARDNAGDGIESSDSSEITVNQMNIDSSFNQLSGLDAHDNGNITVHGDPSGVNTVYVNDNSSYGIISDNSTINLNYVDIDARRNDTGIMGNNGTINITGVVSGSNYVTVNGNTNNGIDSSANGTVNISRVDIQASDNGVDGINANNGTIAITGSGGRINRILAESNDGAAMHAGTGSVINVTNTDIFTSRNGAGILADNGGQIIVNTGTGFPATLLDMRGNTTSSLGADGAGSMVSVTGSDIIFDRYVERNSGGAITYEALQQYGIQAQNGGNVSVTGYPESNEMAFNHSVIAGIGVSAAVTAITNMNIYATRNTLANVTQNGVLNITNSDIQVTDDSIGFLADDGVANITLDGVEYTHTPSTPNTMGVMLSAQSAATAIFNAADSELTGRVETQAGSTSTVNLDNTTWNTDISNATNLNMADSTVNIGINDLAAGNLTVANFDGTGDNTIGVTAIFDGAQSKSDKLIITDSSTGSAKIDVNAIGTGAAPAGGIKVVDNQSGDMGAIFALKYGLVEAGAYEYDLFQETGSGGGDLYSWYLRSVGFGNTMNALINAPEITMSIARAGMSSLNKRLGELRADDCNSVQGLWVRNYNKFISVDFNTKSDLNIFGLEVGYDHRIATDSADRIYVGVMAGYTAVEDIKTENTGNGKNGEGDGYAPSIGAYATWLNTDGYFFDAVIRTYWSNLDMKAYTSGGNTLKYSVDRQITSLGFEFGQKQRYFVNRYSSVVFEPKASIMYMIAEDGDMMVNGSKFEYDDTTSLIGRLALMIGYQTPVGNDTMIEPYVEAGIFNEFMGDTDVSFAGTTYNADPGGIGYDVALGLNAYVGRNTTLYGALSYEKGKKYDSINTNLGMRYSW